tara:strand:+ start:71320 stop:72003 length:684 start_codon:yes stop_codon:yes gene_type:complete
MKIEHIFFDLDHTLWDFEKNSSLTFQQIFSDHQLDVNFKTFLSTYIPINLKYWKLYREEEVSKGDLRYYRLKETFDSINYTINDQLIDKLSEDYIEKLPNYNHLFDGAIEILEYLKPKYQLHIITNGFEEVQNLKMKKSGIIHFFDEIITSESVGVKKPNPLVFHHALEKTKASPKNSMMIGDNLEADIEGALNCGFSAIHCDLEKVSNTPKNINSVHYLLEIKQYL